MTARSTLGRRRIGLLLGSLSAVAAAVLLLSAGTASAASPALVFINNGDTLVYQAGAGTANNVNVFLDAQGRPSVSDSAGITGSGGCPSTGTVAHCGTGIKAVVVNVRDGNDKVTPEAPVKVVVNGDSGRDTVRGGLVRGGASQVTFNGGLDTDRIDYSSADRFVTVNLDNDSAGDGRPGDLDNIRPDVEEIVGSARPDTITGDRRANTIDGGPGADVLNGDDGADLFLERKFATGADVYNGGLGQDLVSYGPRLGGVNVSLNGIADDGAPGELDNVGADVEDVSGGSGADTLVGNAGENVLFGNDGVDHLSGLGSGDDLFGGAGIDTFLAGGGIDFVSAQDGSAESVNCGSGADSAQVDAGLDTLTGCETVQ
jgi:Ca2+-binding RTX toxin-like protein